MPILPTNGNPNRMPDQNRSGMSVNFRLSETLIAVLLGSGISFGSGYAMASSQNRSQNANQVANCNVAQPSNSSVLSPPMPAPRKD